MKRPPTSALQDALKECRSALVAVAVFSFGINLLILTSPLYMLQIYDRVLGSGRVETLVFLTLIAGVAVLVMGLLEAVRGHIVGRIGRWLDNRLAPELIGVSMRGALGGVSLGAQPLRDLSQIRAFLAGPAVNAVFDSPWVPVFIVVIWWMHWALGVFALAAATVLFLIAVVSEYTCRQPLRAAARLSIGTHQKAEAAIRNADVFQAMGMLPGFLVNWNQRNDETLKLQLKAGDRSAMLLGTSKFVRIFVQILILGLGAYFVLQGEMTAGGMIAASILLGRALAPVEQAIGGWRTFVNARDAYDRLRQLLEHLPPLPETMPLPPPSGRLSCEGVIYVPRGQDTAVLQGVSFALDAGEALGIIGPSAAGKSTLCKILVGSWAPTRGHARLDGADLFKWNPAELGPYIGYLPQDVELFGGSVKDNIARLHPTPHPSAVVDAAQTAGVHEMILRFAQGYETEIGEGGSFLSGGQRQRIGLARALYGRPRLIVLDEPNASLDSEGEESLIRAINAAKEWGATVVLVAHNPRILGPVDKILFLRDGRVEAFGPREEMFEKLRVRRVAATDQPARLTERRPPASAPGGAS
jgi:PrtD family type I secretion system ABC transporter